MALIANLQYAWTLFVDPIHAARGWSLAEIQWAFSIFIATETWLTPAAGAIVDRLGPRKGPGLAIATGGVLVGFGWVINAWPIRPRCCTSAPRYPAPGPAPSMPPASATR